MKTISLMIFVVWYLETTLGSGDKERLARELLKNYMASIEPDTTTTLTFGLIIQCSRVDPTSGELITNAWEKYEWTDKRLVWDPKDYGEVKVLRLPANLIWRPDMKVYNSLKFDEDRSETNVVVSNTGDVVWVPSVVYRTFCSIEDNAPNCPFKIGTWTYDTSVVDLKLDGTGIDLFSYYNTTCPLLVSESSAEVKNVVYPCCKESYAHIDFNVKYRSRA
jgi:hypothetical protein